MTGMQAAPRWHWLGGLRGPSGQGGECVVIEFLRGEEGHADAATGVVVLIVAVVLLFLLLNAGVFRGNQPGFDINVRTGS